MTGSTLAQRVADAFNQHGKFTARPIENGRAVEVRHVDTGLLGTTLWLPDDVAEWMWFPLDGMTVPTDPRELPAKAGVDEVVRAVATSLLDERRQP